MALLPQMAREHHRSEKGTLATGRFQFFSPVPRLPMGSRYYRTLTPPELRRRW